MEQGFTQIPNEIARDSSLDPYAKAVLLVLVSRGGANGQCWPSLATIAKEAGCGLQRAQKALRMLKERGLITWVNRTKSASGRASNLYRIRLNNMTPHNKGNGATHQNLWCDASEPMVPRTKEEEPIKKNQLRRERGAREMATSRGEYLPEEWEPSDKAKQWTLEKYPHVNAELELEKFRDYWQAASGQNARKRDWNAAWRNWIRRAEKEYTQPAYKSQAQMLQEMKQTANARAHMQGSALRLIAGGE